MNMDMENIKEFLKAKGAYVGMAVVAAAVFGFLVWRFALPQRTEYGYSGQPYPATFFVTALDFGESFYNVPEPDKTIVINFSQPAHPENLVNYFELTPNVKGRFEQGTSGAEIRFISESTFETGVNYTVKIKAGFASTLGGELTQDYIKNISLRFSADDFKVLKNGRYALLQSVSLYDMGSLTAQVGSNISKPAIRVFKAADPEFAINDILSGTSGGYGYMQPRGKTDTSRLKPVAAKDGVENGDAVKIPEEVGVYLVQAISNDTVFSQVWVSVNTMGVHFRQDDQKFMAAAQDLKTGAPVSGVEFTTYEAGGQKLVPIQTFSFSGMGEFPLEFPNKIDIAIAKKGNEYAYIPVNVNGSLAEVGVYQNLTDSWQSFLYTERPIYKPNDVIKFRGLIRRDNDGLYLLPPRGTKISVALRSDSYQSDQLTPRQEVEVNEHGVFFGEFKLAGNMAAGRYYIDATLVSNNVYLNGGQAYLEILEYKKPPFELQVDLDKDEYTEGDSVKVKIKGSNFSGKPFGRQKVNYKVYALDYYETEKAVYNKSFVLNSWGGMCGGGGFGFGETYYGELVPGSEAEVTLNSAGELELSFDTKKLDSNISQQLTFMAEKQDANGNIITDIQTAVVHNGEVNIFLRPFKNQSADTREPVAVFSAETLSGEKLGLKEFDYSIDQVRYMYENGKAERTAKTVKSGKVTTNAEGIGEFKVEGAGGLESGFDTMEVSVKITDPRGNAITGTQSLYVYRGEDQDSAALLLDISSGQTNLIAGGKARLKIVAPDDMRVLVAFERGRVYNPEWLTLKAGENIYEFEVKDEYMPSITPTFSAFYKNRYYVEGLTFNVPAMKKLQNISVTTDKPDYQPGQVAKITIKATDQQGRPARGASLSLGIIDKAIFALRKSTQLPLHSSFYFFRARRTNNSSSMTGISFGSGAEQGGGGGDYASTLVKDVDVLYWNPDLTTNADGEAVVFIPVLGNTVWKGIVYSSSDATDLGQADFEFIVR